MLAQGVNEQVLDIASRTHTASMFETDTVSKYVLEKTNAVPALVLTLASNAVGFELEIRRTCTRVAADGVGTVGDVEAKVGCTRGTLVHI